MTGARKRSSWATDHLEHPQHKKPKTTGTHGKYIQSAAGNPVIEQKQRSEHHAWTKRNRPTGPSSKNHSQGYVRNRTAISQEVWGCAGRYKGHPPLNMSSATSGHSKALNYSIPNYPSHNSTTTSSTVCRGIPHPLPPLPPLPDDIARVVFTHQGSLKGGNITKVGHSYDRLEFLGDAYIELMATRLVLPRFPHLPVGRVSQQRELLVKNETLAEYSVAYGFGDKLRLPDAYKEMGAGKAKLRTKIMGDVMEAYVAAVIIADPENGFHTAESWLRSLWESKLAAQQPVETEVMDPDAKVALSQKVMGRGIKLEYREEAPPTLVNKEGKRWFHIGAFLTGWGFENVRLGSGTGLSKQEAGHKAASNALGGVLTTTIAGLKREHDRKVREEREREEKEKQERESVKGGAGLDSLPNRASGEKVSKGDKMEITVHGSADDSESESESEDGLP